MESEDPTTNNPRVRNSANMVKLPTRPPSGKQKRYHAVSIINLSYDANTDPVYEEFAVNPRRIASANQLIKSQTTASLRPEPLKRLTSVNSLRNPEFHNAPGAALRAARPSTTDGNCTQKRGPQIFWEDLIDSTGGGEQEIVQAPKTTKRAGEALQGAQSGDGGGRPTSKPASEDVPVKKSNLQQTELSKVSDNESSKRKTPRVRLPSLPPQPLVRFNSSGDFKAVVDDLYGKVDKRKLSSKPSKWTNIRRMTNVKSPVKREEGGIANKPSGLTLKQREEKAIKLKEAAARGWRVIRWYIEHQRLRKYVSGGSLGWTVLKQHLNNMSDVENSRQDLYKRYGIIPTQQSDGSFKTTNIMRPRKNTLKLVAFKRVKQSTSEKVIPKVPAFRQTLLK